LHKKSPIFHGLSPRKGCVKKAPVHRLTRVSVAEKRYIATCLVVKTMKLPPFLPLLKGGLLAVPINNAMEKRGVKSVRPLSVRQSQVQNKGKLGEASGSVDAEVLCSDNGPDIYQTDVV